MDKIQALKHAKSCMVSSSTAFKDCFTCYCLICGTTSSAQMPVKHKECCYIGTYIVAIEEMIDLLYQERKSE